MIFANHFETAPSPSLAECLQLFVDFCQLFCAQTGLGEGAELAEGQCAHQLHLGIRLKAGGVLRDNVAGGLALS